MPRFWSRDHHLSVSTIPRNNHIVAPKITPNVIRARLRRLGIAAAVAIAPLSSVLVQTAKAGNTEYDFINGKTDITAAASYTTGGTAGTGAGGTTASSPPSVTSDVTFDSGVAYSSATVDTTASNALTLGSINDLSNTSLTIANNNGAAALITLGGSSDPGSSVPGSSSGDLLFINTGAALTLTGGAGVTALGLVLGQSGNFDVAGTGSGTINSVISDGGSALALTKTGTGTLRLSTANTYTGATSLNSGTLTLTGSLASTVFNINGGAAFNYSATSATQSFTTTNLNGGYVTVTAVAGDTLNLGSLARTTPGNINFGTTGSITTTTTNTNGILGPWATIGSGTGLSYAVGSPSGSATAITALPSASETALTSGGGGTANATNFTLGNAGVTLSPSSPVTGNTLQVLSTDTSGITLANGGNSITLNGILNSGGSGGGLTISGTGKLQAGGNQELDIINNGQSTTISSVIANSTLGASSLVFSSSGGSLSLSAANTYTGATVVNVGTLYINSNAASLMTSSITVGSGAMIGYNKAFQATVLGANGTIQGAGGAFIDIGNQNSSATFNLNNSYTGPTGFDGAAGVLKGGIANDAFGSNSAITFGAADQTLYLHFNEQVGELTGSSTGGGVILDGSTLTFGGDNKNATFSTAISGGLIPGGATGTGLGDNPASVAGGLVKTGTGTQTLAGSNVYTGSTTISGGVLSVTTLANGGIATSNSAAASGATTLTVGSIAGISANQTVEVVGAQGQTVKSTSGTTVTLNSGLTYAATAGTAYFGTPNPLGLSTNAATNLVLDGGALQYAGATAAGSTDRLFTIGLSTNTGPGTGTIDSSSAAADTLTFSNPGPITYGVLSQADTLVLTGTNTGANTFDPTIGDNSNTGSAVSVVKNGIGAWTVAGANAYSGGTTVNAGTLSSAVAGGFGSGAVTVNPTGTAGTAADAATLNTNGSIASTAAVTVNTNSSTAIGTVNFNGSFETIGSLAGSGNVVLNGSGGTTLTTGNATSTTFSGVISDTTATSSVGVGNLTVAGPGVFTLTGSNTYTGTTTITTGTLVVNALTNPSASLTGTGRISVATGGELHLLSATAQVATPGTVALINPGANVSISGSGVQIALDLGGNVQQIVGGFFIAGVDQGAGIFGSAAFFTANRGDVSSAGANYVADESYFSGDGGLQAVPEPGSIGLLGIAAMGFLGRRRRKTAKPASVGKL